MSEHRSKNARPKLQLIPPMPEEDEEGWLPEDMDRFHAEARRIQDELDRWGDQIPVSLLIDLSRQSFETLVVFWAGLPSRQAERFIEKCVPWWAELKAMRDRNRELAAKMLTKADRRR